MVGRTADSMPVCRCIDGANRFSFLGMPFSGEIGSSGPGDLRFERDQGQGPCCDPFDDTWA